MRALFLLLIALIISYSGFSQGFSVENKNIKDGLPHSYVNCMVQDKQGFLWIGTAKGLCRYDGYNFELIPLGNLNPDEDIISLQLSSDDLLWITVKAGEIFCYDLKLENLVSLKLSRSIAISDINASELQNDTILWVGTRNGLIKFTITKNISRKYFTLSPEVLMPDANSTIRSYNFITSLKIHKSENSLWVGTNSHLFKLDLKKNEFVRIATENKSAVRSITQISEDNLIVGFWNSGMIQLDNKDNVVNSPLIKAIENVVGDSRVLAFLKEDDHSFWIGTSENGVFNFKIENGSITKKQFEFNPSSIESLGSNSASCFLRDSSGIIWIGQLNSGGLSKIVSKRYRLDYIKETSNLNVNSILVRSPKEIWLGTQGNGLIFFDLENNRKTVLNKSKYQQTNLNHNIIKKIMEDQSGNMWIGTHGGGIKILPIETIKAIEENRITSELKIISLDRDEFSSITYISDICKDLNGNFWIGTHQGIYLISSENKNINLESFESQLKVKNYFERDRNLNKLDVFSLYIDHSGYLWVCTMNNGLIRIDPNNQNGEEILSFGVNDTSRNSLQSNKVFNCQQDNNNALWVSSAKGMDIINLNNFSTNPVITSKDIGNNELLNFTFDQKGISWISLSYGIASFDIKKNDIKKYFRPSTYGNFNNLNSIYNSNAGSIYVGSRNGVTFFKPDSFINTGQDFPFYITSFKINNVKVRPGEKVNGRVVIQKNINETVGITLKSIDHYISFDIASLDYFNSLFVEYKYILEGAASDWITLNKGQHSIAFTSLKKGDYTLRIMATNSEGSWNSKELKLKIKVLPPIWQSNSAIVIYSILLLVMLYLYRGYSISREKGKNELKLIHVEKQKSEELNNLKLQFFTNISHEFRTPLSLILSPLEIIINKVKDSDIRQQLNLIERNANRLLFLVNQIIDIRKLDAGQLKLSTEPVNLVGFSNEIYKLFQALALKKQIDFTLQKSEENIFANIDRHYFESVLYNVLSNAFRFTNTGGSIKLKVFTNSQFAYVSVSDTGKGIPKEQISRIFERFFHSSEKGKEWQGAGIGLSFSKSIVEMHNGSIDVESDEGKGSVFTVKLPLLNTTQALPPEDSDNETKKHHITSGLDSVILDEIEIRTEPIAEHEDIDKEFSILIAEDNPDLRKFIFDQLNIKYKVFEAENGKVAWELVQQKKPDLVITDLMMPEMDGMELCYLIKEDENYSHIPVIILTAKNLEEDKIAGYQSGADAYIFKPFKYRFLSLRIENLLALKTKVENQLSDNLYVILDKKIESRDKLFIDRTIALVEENIGNSEFNVDDMYTFLGYSRSNLYRKIKELTGYSAKEFVREIRLQNAAQMFREYNINVNEVAYLNGFESTSYFSKCFKNRFKTTPVKYKSDHIEQASKKWTMS